ncbi:MAG: UBP-type zinc finger domain-containing protein [Chloroflexi bacterium]|nr:UBP-type zinc finger domain-containing protein [Chloroflexota bacterium]
MADPLCPHFDTGFEAAPPLTVCEECVKIGSKWFHLRQCLNCGRTLCCDQSPNRHETAHSKAEGHPMMRSAQPDEDWRWCYPDELFFIPDGDGGYEVAE